MTVIVAICCYISYLYTHSTCSILSSNVFLAGMIFLFSAPPRFSSFGVLEAARAERPVTQNNSLSGLWCVLRHLPMPKDQHHWTIGFTGACKTRGRRPYLEAACSASPLPHHHGSNTYSTTTYYSHHLDNTSAAGAASVAAVAGGGGGVHCATSTTSSH